MGAVEQPKYEAIAAELRQGIERGKWPVGSALPSKDALKKTHGVAQNTVDHAIDILRQQGLVKSKQGVGTFVISATAREDPGDEAVRMLAAKLDSALERLERVERRLDDKLGPDPQ